MTKPTIALTELVEKGADADLLKQMIQFVAQRMMEFDVEGLCGAGFDVKSPGRTNSPNGYRDRLWQNRAAPERKANDYFRDFIGCQQDVDGPGETSALLKAFSDFVESEDLPEDSAREKTQALASYSVAQSKLGEPVSLEGLSELFDEDRPKAFYDHIRNKDYGLSPEIPADKRTLNQFRRFTGAPRACPSVLSSTCWVQRLSSISRAAPSRCTACQPSLSSNSRAQVPDFRGLPADNTDEQPTFFSYPFLADGALPRSPPDTLPVVLGQFPPGPG